jgi:hypothetical protein
MTLRSAVATRAGLVFAFTHVKAQAPPRPTPPLPGSAGAVTDAGSSDLLVLEGWSNGRYRLTLSDVIDLRSRTSQFNQVVTVQPDGYVPLHPTSSPAEGGEDAR